MEGDGTITVSCPGPKHVKVRMFISIKNLRDNVLMLLLIKDVIGGRVRSRYAQYVTWVAIKKDLIQSLIGILKEYPLLTSRKQCQLKSTIFMSKTKRVFNSFVSRGVAPSLYKNNITKPCKMGFSLRFFSSSVPLNISEPINTSTLIECAPPLNPWFVTGFSDGESTFGVSIYKKSAAPHKIRLRCYSLFSTWSS